MIIMGGDILLIISGFIMLIAVLDTIISELRR
jgi:hypothetical protein